MQLPKQYLPRFGNCTPPYCDSDMKSIRFPALDGTESRHRMTSPGTVFSQSQRALETKHGHIGANVHEDTPSNNITSMRREEKREIIKQGKIVDYL